MRGIPTTIAAITPKVDTTASQTGQTLQTQTTAITDSANSSRTLSGPAVATMIRLLSPGVLNKVGRPIRITRTGITSQAEILADAQEQATHAMISEINRRPVVSGVSRCTMER